ncbi:chromosomal replication initiator protein DnaA [Candidatus Gracilibacteria bacterium CG17_big_fil_post_rev_8_21_14_2_50_48_13]|nr:MAG: chromosomal replication initiator protein DnaA [Candidatus Gracilibacteria bacterium CG17_big_fil_post_rev_8_21_14_2_50_48_13]
MSDVFAAEQKELWKNILLALTETIPASYFLTWFKNTALLERTEDSLVVGVPTLMSFNNIADKYLGQLQDCAASVLGTDVVQVQLRLDGTLHPHDARVVDVAEIVRQKTAKAKKEAKAKAKDQAGIGTGSLVQGVAPDSPSSPKEVTLIEGISSKLLSAKYSLENFVVGQSTQLAFAALSAVAKAPGDSYNPVFIYGGVGLGKTHLIQATGNAILTRFPRKKIVYVTSETFTNELISAIGNHKTDQLRKKYRSIDVLIIDDVQFLANKAQTQVEFFHTFNELYDEKKQIILSSDRPPSELTQLEDRLRSRFEWGIIVDVQFPDFETRCAILQMKCKARGLLLSPEVIEFIAHNVHSSIRELEGILNQAVAQYELEHITPTVNSIGPILMRHNSGRKLAGFSESSRPGVRASSIEEIITAVSAFYKVSSNDILGESRKKEISLARQVVMYIAKNDLDMTFERIGELMGGRIHSTVIHSCTKIQKAMKKDEHFRRDINSLRQELGILSS